MERDEFLKSLGISLAMVCAGTCLSSCGKGDDPGEPGTTPGPGGNSNVVSVDIATMATVGSQKTSNGVLFFRKAEGNTASAFVATEAICPHQGGDLQWKPADQRIQCNLHQATYTSAGAVQAPPSTGGSTRALKIYAVSLTGTTLTATKS